MNPAESIGLALCGDVMTGRGVDQALPHSGDPRIYELFSRDARDYLLLAAQASGPIRLPLDYAAIWGDALKELRRATIDVRIVNLETSITATGDPWPGKAIQYRMHPANVGCLTAAGIDCCCLANNHVLDWGYAGLTETLRALDGAGITRAGAGQHEAEAMAPAVIAVPGKGRVIVYSLGDQSSGIPDQWGATGDRAGVNLLPDLTEETAGRIATQIGAARQPGDVVVASIHWGGNWGYEVPEEQIQFAHRLVEGGADIVFGHSSHHVKALEVYRERLILYGAGDFLDDYEGIGGHDEYRHNLRLLYLVHVDPRDGRLRGVRLIPLRSRRLRLTRAGASDARWLQALIDRLGAPFATSADLNRDNSLTLRW